MSVSSAPSRTLTTLAAAAVAVVLPALTLAPSAEAAGPSFTKIQGAAGGAAGLQPAVDAYRLLLGPDHGSAVGPQPAGRREINWDAVPDGVSTPNLMPANLFNSVVSRGAVFSNPNSDRFVVSASNSTGAPRFGNVNAQYAYSFRTFSPEKLFAPKGTTTTWVDFFVPGTATPAYVHGFGAVFTDVDLASSTTIELYDRWGARLWTGDVPRGTAANKSLSFLGVKTSARIARVKITSGNTPLSPTNADGGAYDVVAIDDLVYGEPRAY